MNRDGEGGSQKYEKQQRKRKRTEGRKKRFIVHLTRPVAGEEKGKGRLTGEENAHVGGVFVWGGGGTFAKQQIEKPAAPPKNDVRRAEEKGEEKALVERGEKQPTN